VSNRRGGTGGRRRGDASSHGTGIPVEVIELRPAPAERLNAITARLDQWGGGSVDNAPSLTPTLLILRGFDVFGDTRTVDPTIRSDPKLISDYADGMLALELGNALLPN
jgi:hypothetical protein